MNKKPMTVHEVVNLTGITARTLHYYGGCVVPYIKAVPASRLLYLLHHLDPCVSLQCDRQVRHSHRRRHYPYDDPPADGSLCSDTQWFSLLLRNLFFLIRCLNRRSYGPCFYLRLPDRFPSDPYRASLSGKVRDIHPWDDMERLLLLILHLAFPFVFYLYCSISDYHNILFLMATAVFGQYR